VRGCAPVEGNSPDFLDQYDYAFASHLVIMARVGITGICNENITIDSTKSNITLIGYVPTVTPI
jgi:hypothetical protein